MADAEPRPSALTAARRVARRLGHATIRPQHVLLGALEPPSSRFSAALHAAQVELGDLRGALESSLDEAGSDLVELTPAIGPELASELERLESPGPLEDAVASQLLGRREVARALRREAIDVSLLCNLLEHQAPSLQSESFPSLTRYTSNVTERALRGELDPVTGRDNELLQLVQILTRRLKSNPLIVGEPGVGKTALVEGLAQRMVACQVPEALRGFSLFALDLGALLAGTRFRGEFEERLKTLIAELAELQSGILFIDEIHMLVGAGSTAGGTDAANLLKPALARGELKCIGATTPREYRSSIEKDAALSRRFEAFELLEPEPSVTLAMLRRLTPAFEAHHEVQIEDDALRTSIALGQRYLTERRFPDKAIDLVDQAAAFVRSESVSHPLELRVLRSRIERLEADAAASPNVDAAAAELAQCRSELKVGLAEWLERRTELAELSQLERQLSRAEANLERATLDRRFAEAARLQHQRIPELRAEVAAARAALGEAAAHAPTVDERAVRNVVSRLTGVPVQKLGQVEAERLACLEATLTERVKGQPTAVALVSRAIRRARANLQDPRRPIASFLLVGSSGVGKTELCKAVAASLFADESAFIRLDMSEYQEKHSVSRLIGAPPGYVGFDAGGELTNRVRRKAYSVVLFDEVEKAHPDVFNLLLQVLDEGQLMDSSGLRVDFKNTIVMLTSNLGAEAMEGASTALAERCLAAVKRHFRPEFLNRLGDTVVFEPLGLDALAEIVRGHFEALKLRLAEQRIALSVEEAAHAEVARQTYDCDYGARPIARFIRDRVEDAIADGIVDGRLASGGHVRVTADLKCLIEAQA